MAINETAIDPREQNGLTQNAPDADPQQQEVANEETNWEATTQDVALEEDATDDDSALGEEDFVDEEE